MKLIIGAADTVQDGWISTDIRDLDVTKESNWINILGLELADNILSEHVWEHLTPEQSDIANKNVFKFLRPGGKYRIAVPDGFHRDPNYIEYVKPGGYGAGAFDHKVLYNYKTLSKSLENSGFVIDLLEYWDENGIFHHNDWDLLEGKIERSMNFDDRNKGGELKYTSLIIDAIKK